MPLKKSAAKSSARKTAAGNGGGNAGATRSKADVFGAVKPQGKVDEGKYEAVIQEFVMQDADEKGQSARIKYEIADEGDFRGQVLTQFYKVFEADESAGKGAAFLKKDLAVLGYEDVGLDDLEGVMEEIVKADTGVLISVKQNGQFTNCYLGGLAEDSDVIKEYLANRPPY